MESHGIMQSLTEEQQMEVYNLMSIGNIEDINLAAQLLVDANFDLNRATQKFFDIQAGVDHPPAQHDPDMAVEGHHMDFNDYNPVEHVEPIEEETTDLRTLYKRHLLKKSGSEDWIKDPLLKGATNVVSGVKSAWNSYIPTSIRGETPGGEQFINFLKKNFPAVGKQIKFNIGTFEENVQKAAEYKKPLLVYIHVSKAQNHEVPTNVLSNTNLVNTMNNRFHVLGLLHEKETTESISKFIDIKEDCYIGIFRLNLLDEIHNLETITITKDTNPNTVSESLKNIEGDFYLLMSEEDKIKTEVKKSLEEEERNRPKNDYYPTYNPRDYEPQTGSVSQPRKKDSDIDLKLEEDRMLRQLQEEEFKEVERQIREKQNIEASKKEIEKNKQIEEEIIRIRQEEERVILEEEKKKEKEKKLNNLPVEPAEGEKDTLTVVFRLPSGDRLERRFWSFDKVEALYDFIDTRDIDFDKSTTRYDLIQPRPFLCLDIKEKTLGDYFEGSDQEVIQVREHSD